jgi:hypothetical protein
MTTTSLAPSYRSAVRLSAERLPHFQQYPDAPVAHRSRLVILDDVEMAVHLRNPAFNVQEIEEIASWTEWMPSRWHNLTPQGGIVLGFPETQRYTPSWEYGPSATLTIIEAIKYVAMSKGLTLDLQAWNLSRHPHPGLLKPSYIGGVTAKADLVFNDPDTDRDYASAFSFATWNRYGLAFKDPAGGYTTPEQALQNDTVIRNIDSVVRIDELIILRKDDGYFVPTAYKLTDPDPC